MFWQIRYRPINTSLSAIARDLFHGHDPDEILRQWTSSEQITYNKEFIDISPYLGDMPSLSYLWVGGRIMVKMINIGQRTCIYARDNDGVDWLVINATDILSLKSLLDSGLTIGEPLRYVVRDSHVEINHLVEGPLRITISENSAKLSTDNEEEYLMWVLNA